MVHWDGFTPHCCPILFPAAVLCSDNLVHVAGLIKARELLMSSEEVMHTHRKCRLMESPALEYRLWFFSLSFFFSFFFKLQKDKDFEHEMFRLLFVTSLVTWPSWHILAYSFLVLWWFCGLYFCSALGPLTIITCKMNIPSKIHH